MNVKDVMKKILDFRDKRDWQQFHDPKNLAAAIAIESAELQEVFLWSNVDESRKIAAEKKQKISQELADIFIFSLLFAHETGIDIGKAVLEKIELNDKKYPVEKSKGTSKKYRELD
ncbi:MAG: nucleotide pyrophosphohydrolase [Candidatus Aminicenantes bacterium]|nr:nucleotide pyrophosphohydrolase [Candidatus Aminicenantes bacterium]NIM84632.1 nucleotide pyrophosphohydrolase [Candidatus Aminicenantes bacterium]NIN24137.1 nucleotide pyrophosphohydrolase [Candidatus Aminicenantes bacterium]NIN47861.1 nucleotide pyrophosphohydrolase [Candidatus Aminicenantes bacterium]NIN90799.1 nucleotide pyrophosphohydrolase [Candidatus Aminicenantes bacterium]